ncbi:MAG: type 1 glutamine amidotransferase [Desulfatitalea sp.]|nr:type 1 glutamine amidotransferase [Desulfatitalea sp.]MBI5896955.1 type 1 glutamine amidotransferase [Desulfobacterales bacterium]
MRIHYLQHVPFEGLGYIQSWARQKAHGLSATALFADEALPPVEAFDLLVIMGGPMGVYDSAAYPWLVREKRFIEQALAAKKKVLGICLGAQLMADALGAKVFKNRHKEIGWHPLTRAADVQHPPGAALFPERFCAFHWHGDTFDLPAGALHLAQSEACRHQAFFYPPGAVGLQFHLESTPESIEQLIAHCGHELVPGPYIQGQADIRGQMERIGPSNVHMGNILDFLAGS